MAWGFSSSIQLRVSSSKRYLSVSFWYIQSSTTSDVASHPKVYSVRLATSVTPRYPWRFRPSMNLGFSTLLRYTSASSSFVSRTLTLSGSDPSPMKVRASLLP